MNLLKKSADVYKNYVDFDYTFTLDCDISLTVAFRARNFYHLVGLQYLTVLRSLIKPVQIIQCLVFTKKY